MSLRTGADLVCNALEHVGVTAVFGVPGTQNVPLFEALRRSKLHTVATTQELSAAFMANGYARASGRVGVLVTIPGPGFTCALTGLAEARLDSVPLLHITGTPARAPGQKFRHQEIDQARIAGPLVKKVMTVEGPEDVAQIVIEAYQLALVGEPGPVVVQLSEQALQGTSTRLADPGPAARGSPPSTPSGTPGAPPRGQPPDPSGLVECRKLLDAATRPLIIAGQGCHGAADALVRLAERLGAPVATTGSGRGVIPEDHPLALGRAWLGAEPSAMNAVLAEADLVLVIGAKLSHNGTSGFEWRIDRERLIHVDASREVLGANYPARLAIEAEAGEFLEAVKTGDGKRETGDGSALAAQWREQLAKQPREHYPEPKVAGGHAAEFCAEFRTALPREAILVTDSGLHQVLATRHYTALAPRSLIVPSDFQSMGFGVPAGLGAKLAAPDRPVVVVTGDGGLMMSGMELATAVRDQVPIVVLVFNDRQLNLIRLQQLREYGHAHGVTVQTPDLEAFAGSIGIEYLDLGNPGASPRGQSTQAALRRALEHRGPVLVDVPVHDSGSIQVLQAKSAVRETARRALGARLVGLLKRLLRR